MKHLIKVVVIFCVFQWNFYSQDFSQLDSIPKFRGIEWEETLEFVKAKEIAKYMQRSKGFGVEILSFHGVISKYKARIDYVFKDNKLIEGIYEIEVESFEETYEEIKNTYFRKLDIPNYWASSHPDSDFDWNGEEDNLCRGPEIYWEYCDGFIAIIAEKYKSEITISILFAHEKTIQDYGKYVTFPFKMNSES